MSKFGSLTADTEKPFRKFLDDPKTGKPIADKDGNKAYIDVLPEGGDAAKAFDKEERDRLAEEVAAGNPVVEPDALVVRKRKTARLTTGWYLVDPDSGEHLDVPCNESNARELYLSNSLMAQSIWVQAHVASNQTPNFIQRSPKPSTASPGISSGKDKSSPTAGQ